MVLPLLAIVITYTWLQWEQAPLIEGRLINSFFRATWQPLLYFWQVMILLFSFRFLFSNAFPRQVFERKHIVIGILAGLGSGLINVFIISVISNLPVNQSLALSSAVPPPLLKWASMLLAISLAPFAFERFFRQILLQSWQTRFGSVKGFWLVAVAFAVIDLSTNLDAACTMFRDTLWVVDPNPAFCNGRDCTCGYQCPDPLCRLAVGLLVWTNRICGFGLKSSGLK